MRVEPARQAGKGERKGRHMRAQCQADMSCRRCAGLLAKAYWRTRLPLRLGALSASPGAPVSRVRGRCQVWASFRACMQARECAPRRRPCSRHHHANGAAWHTVTPGRRASVRARTRTGSGEQLARSGAASRPLAGAGSCALGARPVPGAQPACTARLLNQPDRHRPPAGCKSTRLTFDYAKRVSVTKQTP